MAEPTKYVVVCCTGHPLAYLDDNRAVGGELTVTAPPGEARSSSDTKHGKGSRRRVTARSRAPGPTVV